MTYNARNFFLISILILVLSFTLVFLFGHLVGYAATMAGLTERVSIASDGTQGNNRSWRSRISADARYVAFDSNASNLVSGDTNENFDVFVHDRVTGETTRISVASDGMQGNGWSAEPSITTDGRYVAFNSPASNLVHLGVNDK